MARNAARSEWTPPLVREFLHDAAEEVFSVDGKLWRTLKLLFLQPGALTVELVNGRRASSVKPLRTIGSMRDV